MENEQIIKELKEKLENKDKYNGYENYETWALSLHLTNTQGLYNPFMEIVGSNKSNIDKADELKVWVEDMYETFYDGNLDTFSEDIKSMMKDIGSIWRINWLEVIKTNMEN
jgi:hypothetical protein